MTTGKHKPIDTADEVISLLLLPTHHVQTILFPSYTLADAEKYSYFVPSDDDIILKGKAKATVIIGLLKQQASKASVEATVIIISQ